MSNAKPLRVPFPFDEAIRRMLRVKPPPKPRKRRRGVSGKKKRGKKAA